MQLLEKADVKFVRIRKCLASVDSILDIGILPNQDIKKGRIIWPDIRPAGYPASRISGVNNTFGFFPLLPNLCFAMLMAVFYSGA